MFDINVQQDQIWMIVVGFIIAFILAFGIGANDVANSFGTSVGSRVLTLRQAFILACIFETLGAVLLGAKVSDTIRKGIFDLTPYENNTGLLMVGNVAALSGSCVWLIAATLLRLPVSATHSIVGSTVGFALVAHGYRGIHWDKLAMIIGSWFISPVLAGGVSIGLFFICKFFILSKVDQLEPGLRFLPIFYAATIVINLFSVFYDGPPMLGFDKIPLWGTFIISFGCGALCAVIIRIFVVPWQRRRIKAEVFTATLYAEENGVLSQQSSDVICGVDTPTGNGSANVKLEAAGESKMCNGRSKNLIADVPADEKKSMPSETFDVTENSKKASKKGKKPQVTPNLSQVLLVNGETEGVSTTLSRSSSIRKSNRAETAVCDANWSQSSPVTNNQIAVISQSTFNEDTAPKSAIEQGRLTVKDSPEACRLFAVLQILTAVFGAFAHGGNDVSNAIGPLVSLWLIGTSGNISYQATTPVLILLFGGVAISIGLCVLGYRVIKTLGEDLTKITPSSGFCIEIGSALTVLIASNVGIPISTTHCKVGSVVFVGRFRARENVDWSIFRNIVVAWLVTLPIAGGISAAIMAGLRLTVPDL